MAGAASAIRAEMADLDREINRLMNKREGLNQALRLIDGPPRRATSGRRGAAKKSTARKTARKRGGRAARGSRREDVLKQLSKNPVGPSVIAKSVGISSSQVSSLLKNLSTEGTAKKTKDGWVAV